MVLEDAPQKLTRGDILAEWPADFDKPSGTTLKTWLGRAVERGIILCEGTGRKADPYRYFLRETEAKWREKMGPELYDLLHEQECKFGWKSLQEKKALDGEYDVGSTGTAGAAGAADAALLGRCVLDTLCISGRMRWITPFEGWPRWLLQR